MLLRNKNEISNSHCITTHNAIISVDFVCRVHDLSKKKIKQVDTPVANLISENGNEQTFLEQFGSIDEICTALALHLIASKKPLMR